jgi:hypothetical protein
MCEAVGLTLSRTSIILFAILSLYILCVFLPYPRSCLSLDPHFQWFMQKSFLGM